MPLDAYYVWLGIPPAEQPPNHYRLLGISLLEANEHVIEAAAIRQTLHVDCLKLGEHSSNATRILQEIEVARICLLSPPKKAAYDDQLRDPKPARAKRIEITTNSVKSSRVASPASSNAGPVEAISSSFDAYYQWLGIPANEQPPDHYRLLGVPRFESNTDVINHAADRQMGFVRTFEASEYTSTAEQLLNQIAAARLCLTNSSKRAQYDRRLVSANAAADVLDENISIDSQRPPPRKQSLPVAVPIAPNESAIARQQETKNRESLEHSARNETAAGDVTTTIASAVPIDDREGVESRNRVARSHFTDNQRRMPFYLLGGVSGCALLILLVVVSVQSRDHDRSVSDDTVVMDSTVIEPDEPSNLTIKQATPSSITTKARPSGNAENEGVRPIFNGVDLLGWTAYRGRVDTWQVEDGAIVTVGRHKSSWLLTDVDYADFRWSFEFLVEPHGDSGVTIRANPMDSLGKRQKNLEINLQGPKASVQLKKTFPTGGLFWTQATRVPMRPDTLAELDSQAGWNEMVIEARGPIVKVSVNGQILSSYDLEFVSRRPGAIPNLAQPTGRIGFQSWDKVARFRNIRIENLPATP